MNLKLQHALIPLTAAVLVACGGNDDGQSTSPASSKDAAAPAASPTTLRMIPEMSTGFIRNYNPLSNAGSRIRTTRDFMYEPLLIVNEMQGGQIHYRLAESATFSDNLLSLDLTLRDQLKWSDGQDITVDDFIFTLELLEKHPELDQAGLMNGKITGVEKLSDQTVRLQLAEANYGFLAELANSVYMVPKHDWQNVDNPTTYTNENPVASGPMTEIARFTSNIYVQCRNPHYWDADNLNVDCLEVPQVVDNNAALVAAQNGSIDWFAIGMMEPERVYVSHNPEHHRFWFPAGGTVALAMNFNNQRPALAEAFSSLEFRKALSLSMDRPNMVTFANPAATLMTDITGMGATYAAWENPEVAAEYAQYLQFNLEQAKAYLAAGGFVDTNNNGYVETPNGLPLQIEIQVPNGWTDWVNTVEIAVEGLRDAGINARMSTPEWGLMIDRRASGEFEMLTNGYGTGSDPFNYFNGGFHSQYQDICNEAGTQGWFAISRYCNPQLDALLDSFNQTADQAERMSIMHEIQAVWAADMPTIPLYNNPLWYQYSTERFEGWWSASNPKGNPSATPGNPARLLLLLDLKPKS